MKKIKKIPKFENEDEERDFWGTHDTTDYFDMDTAEPVSFPNLKLTPTKSISIRLPEKLIFQLKTLANKNDVPYQSLMKIFLAERVEKEFRFKQSS